MAPLAAALSLALAAISGPRLLEQAESELAALKYVKAAATLAQLEAAHGLTRTQTVRALALDARVKAALGRTAEAREAFVRLLEVEPRYELEGRAAPKITGPYFEAKAVARALEVTVTASPLHEQWAEVKVALSGPLNRLSSVRVQLAEDGLVREKVSRPLPELVLPVNAKELKVVVVLEDARAWVMGEATLSFDAPLPPEETPVPVAVEAPAPVREPPAPVVLVQQAREPEPPRLRPLAFTLFGLGAVSAAVGTGAYIKAASSSSDLQRAVDDAAGGVLPITRARAVQLNSDVRDFGLAAWVGWIAGGALVTAALIFFIVGAL